MRLHLSKPKGFSLDAASAFYASFTPGSGMAAADTAQLTLAFRLDGTFEAVAVALSESDETVTLDVVGTMNRTSVEWQVRRILGLDADGDAWRDVGRRDPVVGRLQRSFSGFFTAAKSSPYDAATWGILVPRLSMTAAAKIKMEIARAHGDEVTLGGRVHHVFPSPRALKALRHVEGLADEKTARLHAVADAALEGRLDAERLRAMTPEEALADLQSLRGVGRWTASHIYFRGAAPPDALPTIEPRVLRGWGLGTGIDRPSIDMFTSAAEAWRPFRMWVSVLLARHLARSGDWNALGIAKERAQAIRAVGRDRPGAAIRSGKRSAS